ncbi:MAG: protein-L-isoaspartate O-methyltransferase [Ignavibacteria bacterium RIFOXYB2_FULL_35_12]|nr:MAG: protein-L-isoaspartate O-methyltransferase [Ignavibacteria bacterium GWA2_36_19]OGU57128.1 MAG: protein-L-isoaspartate O-methyltransferase [Ignavibacteria bacterium GWF2_35_20]OGU83441.1 MAG: protein-L-isoaspartate O-methyltransferase [Ignavibacteria bacterium RIFOXYA2_FULL_35_9]OGU88888.1 MAG: protein-L-isoaspartate O-methyltransferase [Ignavibacteria bacterium RIFOXYA12_FULL_35_25]OGU90614.1 MAG: protein-L-isoaspartate O-methyltransferase [Ignavibacteria bacterium RIFOXYC12_FULL_35_11
MYEKERQELVDKISKNGITDVYVLKAISEVERHKFVPEALLPHAYKDVALPIGYGQTISQPYTVAFMTQSLKVQPDSKILEIGTGSGYQAALLYRMGAKVYSIERQFEIYDRTRKLLDELEIRVNTKCGDGTIGWEEFAPFDGILVTAGSPNVPPSLQKQLAVGGKLVIPVGDKVSQKLRIVTKVDVDKFETVDIPEFVFVPLIGKEGWKQQ